MKKVTLNCLTKAASESLSHQNSELAGEASSGMLPVMNVSERSVTLDDENEKLQRQVSQLQVQLLDLQSKCDNATQLSQQLSVEKNDAIQNANKTINELKGEIESMKDLKAIQNENVSLKKEVQKMNDIKDENKSLKQLNQNLQKQVLEIDVLQSKLDFLTTKNNELNEANKNLEASLSEFKNCCC